MFYFRGPIDFQALIIVIFHSSFPVFLAGYAFNAILIKEKGKNCLSNFQITIHAYSVSLSFKNMEFEQLTC